MGVGAQVNIVHGTWFGEVLGRRSDSIVVGRFQSSTDLPNQGRLVRVSIVQVLKGREAKSVLIHADDERLLAHPKLSKIYFLKRSARGTMRRLVDVVDCPTTEAESRVGLVRRLLALDNLEHGQAQAQGVKSLVVGGQHVASSWVRSILCRELERICDHAPAVFVTRDLLGLLKFRTAGLTAQEKLRLRKGILKVEAANAVGWTASRLVFKNRDSRLLFLAEHARFQQSKDAKRRREFLTRTCETFGVTAAPVLVSALNDEDSATVLIAIRLAGDIEAGACVDVLLKKLAAKSSRSVWKEVVEALGKIGHPRTVEALQKLMLHSDLGAAARTALARINSGEAALLLQDLVKKRQATGDINDPIWVQIRYLQSDAFRRDEHRRVRAARKRWRRSFN